MAAYPLAVATALTRLRANSMLKEKTGDGVQVQGAAAGVFLGDLKQRYCAGTKPIATTERCLPGGKKRRRGGPYDSCRGLIRGRGTAAKKVGAGVEPDGDPYWDDVQADEEE